MGHGSAAKFSMEYSFKQELIVVVYYHTNLGSLSDSPGCIPSLSGVIMTRIHPIHPNHRPTATVVSGSSQEATEPSGERQALAGRSSAQRVNELLRAFSDTAYSFEEEEHSWESWNYSRLSAF